MSTLLRWVGQILDSSWLKLTIAGTTISLLVVMVAMGAITAILAMSMIISLVVTLAISLLQTRDTQRRDNKALVVREKYALILATPRTTIRHFPAIVTEDQTKSTTNMRRAVIGLRDEGKSFEEIAQLLNLSRKQVLAFFAEGRQRYPLEKNG